MRRMQILQVGGKDAEATTTLLPKQHVRIGPSSIPGAGQGVFATQNIKAGTIVGFYPVHAIGLERFDTNVIVTATPQDDDYFNPVDDDDDEEGDEDDNTVSPCHNYLHYLIGSRPLCGFQVASSAQQQNNDDDDGSVLFIDVNPARAIAPEWIGHCVNDGAIVRTNSEEGLLEYYRQSSQKKNCVAVPFGPAPIMAAITTSKVQKGDELFTTYGGSYWLETLLAANADDDEEEEEEATDITEKVQLQARQTAQDIFTAMKQAQVTHAALEADLHQRFSSIALVS